MEDEEAQEIIDKWKKRERGFDQEVFNALVELNDKDREDLLS